MTDKAQGAKVEVRCEQIWIVNGNDSFRLAYEPESDVAANWYADRLRAALKAQPAPTEAQEVHPPAAQMAECKAFLTTLAQGGFLVRITPTDPEYADVHPQLALEDALRDNPYGWPDGFQFAIVAAQGEDSARQDGEIANGGA